ncbi:MAG: glutaredoxin 3 [Pseudomonadota bacterium]
MSSPEILLYVKETCPYCLAAKRLLKSKGVSWTEVSLLSEPNRRDEMIGRSGRKTVPQVFIGDKHIGGFDDLDALDQGGALDTLLGL